MSFVFLNFLVRAPSVKCVVWQNGANGETHTLKSFHGGWIFCMMPDQKKKKKETLSLLLTFLIFTLSELQVGVEVTL